LAENYDVKVVSSRHVATDDERLWISKRFLHFLHCWKVYEICHKTYTTLPVLP